MKYRHSPLANVNDQEFTNIYLAAQSYIDVCRHYNLRPQGSNYRTIKKIANRLGLPKIVYNRTVLCKSYLCQKRSISNEEMFTAGSKYSNTDIKKRILQDSLLPYQCQKCDNTGIHMGETLSLQIDHIDGDRTNNSLDNLRFMCPNCHSQTSTFGGKALKRTCFCKKCSKEYAGYGETCRDCYVKGQKTKIIWPNPSVLFKRCQEEPYINLVKELGVSQAAIVAFLKRNGLDAPRKKFSGRYSTVSANGRTQRFQTIP